MFGNPRERSQQCSDSEGKPLREKFKLGQSQMEDECTKRIHEFRDFGIYNNRKYGYLTIGNLDFSDSCNKKPYRKTHGGVCSLMDIHESSKYIPSSTHGSLYLTKKDFHKNLHDRLECYGTGEKICYIKDFNDLHISIL